jgi:hypothetical protein
VVKKYLAFLLALVVLAPLSALAHAGHEHGGTPHEQARPEQPPTAGQDQTQIEIMQENIMLKKELEKLKMDANIKAVEKETEKAATRSSFVVTGMLFIAVGLVIRYLPRKEEK